MLMYLQFALRAVVFIQRTRSGSGVLFCLLPARSFGRRGYYNPRTLPLVPWSLKTTLAAHPWRKISAF